MSSTRVRAALVAVIPIRIALDWTWPWPLPGGGSIAQVGGAALAIGVMALAALRWRTFARHPLRAPFAGWAVCVALAALRSERTLDAVGGVLHLLGPVAWLLALHAWWDDRPVPGVWAVAAGVGVGASLVALIAGQPQEHVLHGWPRLIGPYANLHSHAMAMATFAAVLGPQALDLRDGRRGAVAVGAAVATGFTWVRTAWLFVGIALFIEGSLRRRVSVRLGLGIAGACASLLGVVFRDRWSDAWAVLTLTPPEGGWSALGSWRLRIWTDSFATWSAGPTDTWLLGRGLGGQWGLHRHLDPHSDLLSVLYQAGPFGLAIAGWGLAATAVALARCDAPERSTALGVLGAAIVAATLSNDVLYRPTVLWFVAAVAGIALARGARDAERRAT